MTVSELRRMAESEISFCEDDVGGAGPEYDLARALLALLPVFEAAIDSVKYFHEESKLFQAVAAAKKVIQE